MSSHVIAMPASPLTAERTAYRRIAFAAIRRTSITAANAAGGTAASASKIHAGGMFASSRCGNTVESKGAPPASVAIDKVAYLSIDMNLVLPEIAALEFFWDRLVPGGIVVLDDYAFEGHRQQHDAINAFAARRGVPVYTSPTGQGLIVRPPY